MSEEVWSYIPDHRDRARDVLPSQFHNRPRIEAALAAIAAGIQRREDESFDFILSRRFSLARGIMLDRWGELLGEGREGAEDDDYRRFLSARLLVNRCQGSPAELVMIWRIITAPFIFTDYYDKPPAGARLLVVRNTPMSETLIARVKRTMEQARVGGVALDLIEGSSTPLTLQDDMQTLDGPLFTRRL